MPLAYISAAGLLLAATGAWMVRRHGAAVLWRTAAVLAALLFAFALLVPELRLTENGPSGFGASRLETRWLSLAALGMAAGVHVAARRRLSQRLAFVVGTLIGWLGWLSFSAVGYWIS